MATRGSTPVADGDRTGPTASRAPMPAELKSELRRLVAKILVMDYRADHQERTADPIERSEVR